MKKIAQLGVVLLAVTFGALAFGQQTPPPIPVPGGGGGGGQSTLQLPMIASRDALRSYALELVVQAWGFVWSASSLQSEQSSFSFSINEKPVNIRSFHKEVASRPLSFKVANPQDWVSLNVTYATRDGQPLFQGGNSARFIQDPNHPGQWNFPENLSMELYLAWEIPLVGVSNVYYARLLLQDERGQTASSQSLRIDPRTGMPFFPAAFAGANGFLILNMQNPDGTTRELVFNLRNGLLQEPASGKTTLDVTIRDVIEAELNPLNAKLSLVVQSYNGYGESPTVQLRVQGSEGLPPGVGVDVSFYAETTEGELPIQIGIRQLGLVGQITWYWFPLLQNGDSTPITLAPGLYHVIFMWHSFKPYPPYIPGHGDGGKG